jgi:D-3-phosphoglycerate dehydrogenase
LKIVFIDQDIRVNVINGEEAVSPLKAFGDVTYYDDAPCSQDVLYERGRDADVIFFKINQFSNELIDRFTNLKFLQFMGIGYGNYLDANHCAERGITVRGIGEYGSNPVAEFALALILCSMRHIIPADRRMKAKIWDTAGLLGGELSLSTVGIIGTGAIGSLVARKVSLLGAKALAFDNVEKQELKDSFGVRYTSLETLMRESDIVTVHLSYTAQTERLITGELLSLMKPESFFINLARAQIVDYAALRSILERGGIRGAAIDVHYGEPPADWSLALMENVIATPHMGYFTASTNTNMLKKSVESVLDFLNSSDFVGH